MYDFIFIIYYGMFSRTKDSDPKDSAINLVAIVIFFHLFLLHNAITFFTNTNLLALGFGKDHSKYFWLPFVVAFMIFIYRFYKKRSATVVSKYSERQNILSWKNIVFVLVITIGPLLLGIYFLNANV
jgi:hypothetical protein